MHRQYAFALTQIQQGRTVLIYRGITARSAKHVKRADRLELRNGVLYCDGECCAGLTLSLKPEGKR